jgi:predicted nucleic acid-binding protein
MLFDSTFLIQLSGNRGKAAQQAAEKFLSENPGQLLYTSRVCWAEFAEGCETQDDVEEELSDFTVVEIDRHVGWVASRISRELKASGSHIGDNDTWIAATALAHSQVLVSRNLKHFERVPRLQTLVH